MTTSDQPKDKPEARSVEEQERLQSLNQALSKALEVADLALEQAERANSAQKRFMANLSHEVRNPLNNILGLTGLVLQSELPPRQRQYLELIERSGRRLLDFLNQVLSYAKLEKSELQLNESDFDLPELLRDIFELYPPLWQQRGVLGQLELAPDLPTAWRGDPQRLRQVVVNLLENAGKFTARGQITLSAGMKDLRGRSFLHCRVTDTGCGIAPDKVKKIFAPFTQADHTVDAQYGGTGLGLTICRQLISLMGGEIWLESREGQGSTFHFTLPRILPIAATTTSEPAGMDGTAAQTTAGKAVGSPSTPEAVAELRILVVDDDYVNRLVTSEIIKGEGWQASTAADGREALELLAGGEFDLVLLDLQMPVMDGAATAAAIRAGEGQGGDRLPLIAMTGLAGEEELAHCLAVGFDDHLLKPFSREELKAAVFRHTSKAGPRPG